MDNINWNFQEKWPGDAGDRGFTMVPTALLECYRELGLTPGEFLILVNIESYRWSADKYPFPSITTLSGRTGMSERNVTRTISSLQNRRGVLERFKRRGTSNQYDLNPLVEKLNEIIASRDISYYQKRHNGSMDLTDIPF